MRLVCSMAGLGLADPGRLISLSAPDIAIIALYFIMVLGIGFYLRKFGSVLI